MATLTGKKFVDSELLKSVITRIGTKAAGNLDEAKTYAEGLVTGLRGEYTGTVSALAGLVGDNASAIAAHATEFSEFKVSNTAAIAAAKSAAISDAKTYTDQVKQSILGEGLTTAFDTLKEVEDWINDHGTEAANMLSSINANTAAIAAHATEFNDFKVANTAAIAAAKSEAISTAASDATNKVGALRDEIVFATAADVEAALVAAGF